MLLVLLLVVPILVSRSGNNDGVNSNNVSVAMFRSPDGLSFCLFHAISWSLCATVAKLPNLACCNLPLLSNSYLGPSRINPIVELILFASTWAVEESKLRK